MAIFSAAFNELLYEYCTQRIMSQGAALQNYNNELVKGINALVAKRDALQNLIQKQQESRVSLQTEIRTLLRKLKDVDENLAKNIKLRNEYDIKIAQSEGSYLKILEGSQNLLADVKSGSQDLFEKLPPTVD